MSREWRAGFVLVWAALTLAALACNLPARQQVQSPLATLPFDEATHTPSPSPLLPTPPLARTATPTPTHTITPTPTESGTPTITPTYAILRGKVLERANCRYGPGAMYLYKYGLVPGSNLEVFGRNDLGTWILIRAISGTNPCWVKASLMELKGDVMSIQPTYIPLPQSPYYGPPTGVWAGRRGDEVTITWDPVGFRAGDDTASPPYLVEAWVCVQGELVFTPVGSYATMITIRDEGSCSEPSHGRLFTVEKHGYSRWIEIPWPTPSQPPPF